MCDQWFQVLDENGNPIVFNAEAGAYTETGEGGSSTTDSDGKCVVTLEEGKQYEAFARGYKSTPDAPDYACLDCRRIFTACCDTIVLTLKQVLEEPGVRYKLHLYGERMIRDYEADAAGTAVAELGLVTGIITDTMQAHYPPYENLNVFSVIESAELFTGHFWFDITDPIRSGPINPNDVITVVSRVVASGDIHNRAIEWNLRSKEDPNITLRPYLQIEDPVLGFFRSDPTGDNSFHTQNLQNWGFSNQIYAHVRDWTTWRNYMNFGISISLSAAYPAPPLPSPPPTPPGPIAGDTKIGIRGM